MQAAAGNLKKVTLELGGKSPEHRLRRRRHRSRGRGRGERDLLQPRSVLRAPARACSCSRTGSTRSSTGVAEIAKSIKLGPGMDADTQMGPLVSDEQLQPGHRLPGRRAARTAPRRSPAATQVRRQGLLRRADRAHQHHAGHEDRPRGDLRPGRGRRRRSSDSTTSPQPPTTPTTVSAPASGPRTSPRRTRWRRSSAPARSGSTATTSSTRRCRSAATSSRAGAARWATRPSRPTPRSRPSPPSSDLASAGSRPRGPGCESAPSPGAGPPAA